MSKYRSSNQFSPKEEDHLIQFLAESCPGGTGRRSHRLYEKLVADEDGQWPWSKSHPAEAWRTHYSMDQNRFDFKIATYLKSLEKKKNLEKKLKGGEKTVLTMKEAVKLVAFLAQHTTSRQEREAYQVYHKLHTDSRVSDWGSVHSPETWRTDYMQNRKVYESQIAVSAQQRIQKRGTPQVKRPEASKGSAHPKALSPDQKQAALATERDQAHIAGPSKSAHTSAVGPSALADSEDSNNEQALHNPVDEIGSAGLTTPSSSHNRPYARDKDALPGEKSSVPSQYEAQTPSNTRTHKRTHSTTLGVASTRSVKSSLENTHRLNTFLNSDRREQLSPSKRAPAPFPLQGLMKEKARHGDPGGSETTSPPSELDLPKAEKSPRKRPLDDESADDSLTRPSASQPKKIRKTKHSGGRKNCTSREPQDDDEESAAWESSSDRSSQEESPRRRKRQDGTEDYQTKKGTSSAKPWLPLDESDTFSFTQLQNDHNHAQHHGHTAGEELRRLQETVNRLRPAVHAKLSPSIGPVELPSASCTPQRGHTPKPSSPVQEPRVSDARPIWEARKQAGSTPAPGTASERILLPPLAGLEGHNTTTTSTVADVSDNGLQRTSPSASASVSAIARRPRVSLFRNLSSDTTPTSPSAASSHEGDSSVAMQITRKLFDSLSAQYGLTHSTIEDVFRKVNFDPDDAHKFLNGMRSSILRFEQEWDAHRSESSTGPELDPGKSDLRTIMNGSLSRPI